MYKEFFEIMGNTPNTLAIILDLREKGWTDTQIIEHLIVILSK